MCKMPTIVGMLININMMNTSLDSFESKNSILQHFVFLWAVELLSSVELSMNKLYNLGARPILKSIASLDSFPCMFKDWLKPTLQESQSDELTHINKWNKSVNIQLQREVNQHPVADPTCPPFLNILWKWNNFVSMRPNYFISMGYLGKTR